MEGRAGGLPPARRRQLDSDQWFVGFVVDLWIPDILGAIVYDSDAVAVLLHFVLVAAFLHGVVVVAGRATLAVGAVSDRAERPGRVLSGLIGSLQRESAAWHEGRRTVQCP